MLKKKNYKYLITLLCLYTPLAFSTGVREQNWYLDFKNYVLIQTKDTRRFFLGELSSENAITVRATKKRGLYYDLYHLYNCGTTIKETMLHKNPAKIPFGAIFPVISYLNFEIILKDFNIKFKKNGLIHQLEHRGVSKPDPDNFYRDIIEYNVCKSCDRWIIGSRSERFYARKKDKSRHLYQNITECSTCTNCIALQLGKIYFQLQQFISELIENKTSDIITKDVLSYLIGIDLTPYLEFHSNGLRFVNQKKNLEIDFKKKNDRIGENAPIINKSQKNPSNRPSNKKQVKKEQKSSKGKSFDKNKTPKRILATNTLFFMIFGATIVGVVVLRFFHIKYKKLKRKKRGRTLSLE